MKNTYNCIFDQIIQSKEMHVMNYGDAIKEHQLKRPISPDDFKENKETEKAVRRHFSNYAKLKIRGNSQIDKNVRVRNGKVFRAVAPKV